MDERGSRLYDLIGWDIVIFGSNKRHFLQWCAQEIGILQGSIITTFSPNWKPKKLIIVCPDQSFLYSKLFKDLINRVPRSVVFPYSKLFKEFIQLLRRNSLVQYDAVADSVGNAMPWEKFLFDLLIKIFQFIPGNQSLIHLQCVNTFWKSCALTKVAWKNRKIQLHREQKLKTNQVFQICSHLRNAYVNQVSFFPHLITLSIRIHRRFLVEDAKNLFRGLKHLQTLKLTFYNGMALDKHLQIINEALIDTSIVLPKLRSLSFEWSYDCEGNFLQEFINHFTSTLTDLHFYCNHHITSSLDLSIFPHLEKLTSQLLLKKFPSHPLTHFGMHHNKLHHGWFVDYQSSSKQFMDALIENSRESLTSLAIRDIIDLKVFVNCFPNLKHIQITSVPTEPQPIPDLKYATSVEEITLGLYTGVTTNDSIQFLFSFSNLNRLQVNILISEENFYFILTKLKSVTIAYFTGIGAIESPKILQAIQDSTSIRQLTLNTVGRSREVIDTWSLALKIRRKSDRLHLNQIPIALYEME